MFDENQVDFKYLEAINNALVQFEEELKAQQNKLAILIIGPTGSGKSASTNYILGTRYQLQVTENDLSVRLKPKASSQPEKAIVGESALEAQTLLPGLYSIPNKGYVLCDLPGLRETRGVKEALIGAATSTQLIKFMPGIKHILLVVEYPLIQVLRGQELDSLVKSFHSVMQTNTLEELYANVSLVITKVPEHISLSSVLKAYFQDKLQASHLQITNSSSEADKKLRAFYTYFSAHQDQVMLLNICDQGEYAEKLIKRFDNSGGLDEKNVNFFLQDTLHQEWFTRLENTMLFYSETRTHISQLSQRQAERQASYDEITRNYERKNVYYRNELSEIEEILTDLEKQKNELSNQSKDNFIELNAVLENIAQHEGKVSSKENQIKKLQSDTTLISVHRESYSKNAETEHVVIGHPRYCKRRVLGKCVSYGEHTVWGDVPKSGSISKIYSYQNSIPINSATYEENSKSPVELGREAISYGGGKYTVSYTATYQNKDQVIASFSVYAEAKYLSENLNEIEKIKKEIIAVKSELQIEKKNADTYAKTNEELSSKINSLDDKKIRLEKNKTSLEIEQQQLELNWNDQKQQLVILQNAKDNDASECYELARTIDRHHDDWLRLVEFINILDIKHEAASYFLGNYSLYGSQSDLSEEYAHAQNDEKTFNHFGFSGAKASVIELRTAFFFNRDQPKLPSRQLTQLTMLPSEFVDDIQKKSVLEGSQNSFGATYSKITDYDGWSCTYRNEELHCMNPENSQITRTVKRLPYSRPWSELNGDTYNQCTTLEKGHVQVTHCEGEQTEFIEIQPGTPPSLLNSVAQSTLWGATTAIVPEAIGDALYLSGYFSRENANLTTHAVNLAMIAATGSYVPVAVNWITNTVLQKVGFTASTSRMVSNSVSFLTSLGQDITPPNIALSVACYAGSKMGFWAEKKVAQQVEEIQNSYAHKSL